MAQTAAATAAKTVAGEAAPVPGSPDLCTRALAFRAINEEARTAEFVASTDTPDSYGDIVEQDWQLERYLRNPVVLYAHNSRDLPIGQCTQVGVENGQLVCTIRFSSASANPMAECVWQSVRERALRAVSVGFIPHDMRREVRDDRDVYVLSQNELYEISVTPIPANPDALARMRSRARGLPHPTAPAGATGDPMDETTKKALEAAETKARELETKNGELTTRLEALTTQNAALVTARDEAAARATKAEGELVELEVGALVGKKITAAEKPTFVKLAQKDRQLFDELMGQRSAMTLLERDPAGLGGEQLPESPAAAEAEAKAAAATGGGAGGKEFAQLVQTARTAG